MKSFTSRGGWWVTAQFGLLITVLLAPGAFTGLPVLGGWGVLIAGLALGACGVLLSLAGLLHLDANLTPFPRPIEGGTLVQRGAYALVRHPIYSGIIMAAFGWSLVHGSVLTLVLSAGLLVFFYFKSQREERWLIEQYPEYADYQRRVKRLIPFIW